MTADVPAAGDGQASNQQRAASETAWGTALDLTADVSGRLNYKSEAKLAQGIAAALDAAEARGRAEMAAKMRSLVDHYGLMRIVHPGPTLVALLEDLYRAALSADAAPAGQDQTERVERPLARHGWNAHPEMAGHCAHRIPMADHCHECEAGR